MVEVATAVAVSAVVDFAEVAVVVDGIITTVEDLVVAASVVAADEGRSMETARTGMVVAVIVDTPLVAAEEAGQEVMTGFDNVL